MKIVKQEQAEKFKNSEKCEVLEYGLKDKDINLAIAKISGRYPETRILCKREM